MRVPSGSYLARFGLRARLIGVMFTLFALTAALNYWVTNWIERAALEEVQSHVETLSKAIQVSVQQLPVKTRSATDVLRDYQSRLRASGVDEITILDAERRVIASSRTTAGRQQLRPILEMGRELAAYELTMPVIADQRLLGYVNLHLVLDNFRVLFDNMLFYKTLSAVVVLALGIVFTIGVVAYLTKPVEELRRAATEIASGNLDIQLADAPTPDLSALVASFRDMTVRLKEQKRLEQRVREQEKSAALGHMAAGIAHDIRNPLNFVGLALDHLISRAPQSQDEKSRDLLVSSRSELVRVNAMIQDFLDFGREARPGLSSVSVPEVLNASREEVVRRRLADQPKVTVMAPSSETAALANPDLLRRSLVNLLENAVDASGPDGVVRAGAEATEEGRVTIWVEDTGPGMAPEVLDKVFTPYFTTKPSGVGLGLALVKKWVEQMGGRVEARSADGRGCRFQISLPEANLTTTESHNEQRS